MNKQGLTKSQVENSRQADGSNALTQVEQETLVQKLIEGFKDPMIMILMAAFIINIVFVFMGRAEWYEAVGIFVAICIANFVEVFSESSQEDKAQAIRKEELDKEKVKVIRDSKLIEVGINDVVVGDIVSLQAGDKIPADGIVLQGEIKVDQASLNGETKEATKKVGNLEGTDKRDLLNEFYLFRGTLVASGECFMEVSVVGDKTIYGELALEMQEETRDTPLKVKLGVLAGQITKFGYIGAIIIAVAYLLQTLVLSGNPMPDPLGLFQVVLDAISLGVIIVVVAVPEGLPMMIAIVLSMNMGKMMKDNVLVRKLNGIETAGGLNILFSDKTGTITEGKLSVVEVATGDIRKYNEIKDMNPILTTDLIRGIGVNNSSTYSEGNVIGGNSTDRALLHFLSNDEHISKIDKEDVKEFNAFDSNKKSSSVTITCTDGTCKTYIKGAPERIVDRCTHFIDSDGVRQELVERSTLTAYMNEQAGRSMRILAVALANDPDNEDGDLTLVGIISIRDNVRPEAVQAIDEVKNAGVQVVMVTGDRKETAIAIAKEAGIMKENTDIALTSDELNAKTDEQLKEILPNLRVVSRALPTDKSRLVRIAQEQDLVVGMTGDGTNDAPALKAADVGFAMGISGTSVAKEAADIILLDDNFLSIEKAILYGRTIFKSIRKFLIFQLTVNVGALMVSFIAPLMGIAQPISLISLLYINLVMDTFAALAFGSEPAIKKYMEDKPVARSENIITKYMASQVLVIGTFITVVSLLILTNGSIIGMYTKGLGEVSVEFKETAMLVFFMLTVVLNGLFARTEGFNVFENIDKNKQFTVIMVGVVGLLVVLVEVIGKVAGLESLPISVWAMMGVFALGSIPLDMVRKSIIKIK